jgi:transposase
MAGKIHRVRLPCLPRRGWRAEDDQQFLEALHFFTVDNVRWRALLERFGAWNGVWKRFDRLGKAGVFEVFFDKLASMSSSAHLMQMFDSTIVRAHVSAAGAKGAERQALGHPGDGFPTKRRGSAALLRHPARRTNATNQPSRADPPTRRARASNRAYDGSTASNTSHSDAKRPNELSGQS